ncbi:MAG: SBBP repeat-containing protein [Acidobacteriota bacterium]
MKNVTKRSVALFIGLASMAPVFPTGSPFLESGRATLPTGARSLYKRPAKLLDAESSRSLATVDKETNARVNQVYGKLPMSFEANDGQTDSRVKFISRWGGQTLFLTSTEAVFRLEGPNQTPAPEGRPTLSVDASSARRSPVESTNSVLRMKLVGGNTSAKVTGLDKLPGKSNYFIGNDPKKWRTNVPNYAKVKYEQVYPGVDLVYYGNQRQLEYDLIVAPGADPNRIRLTFEGAQKMRIDEAGDLVLSTTAGETRQRSPIVYQELNKKRERVRAGYAKQGENEVAFELGRYDASRPLVIDPVLVYSTYLGGSFGESGNSIAVDPAGFAYITGFTNSNDFPTANPLQPNNASFCCAGDVFVTKLNAAGSALVYSTYIGGGETDQASAIAVDPFGNAYVTGTTSSTDFPTANAFSPNLAGVANDAFVAKLNSAGSAFVYSTYLGGSLGETATSIAVDASGNAYVTGSTGSTDFPTSNPLQGNISAGSDGFITKFNATGTSLVYSTYLGGVGADSGNGIAVDATGNAYVAGTTSSPDFPLVNPVQSEITDKTAFKSIDGAATWAAINNGLPARFSVNTIAIDPGAPNTLYIGTTGGGVFKSTDAGSSWIASNNGLFTLAMDQLLIDPKTTSTLYGISGRSLTRSTDAGMSWNTIPLLGGAEVVALDPSAPQTLYAARGQLVFKSIDSGATWSGVTVRDPLGNIASTLHGLVVDPRTPTTIYAADSGGVFKSINGGTVWRGRLGTPSGARSIAIDPVNTASLYVWSIGGGISKSTDGAQTWSLINSGLPSKAVRVVAIDPIATNTLYAGTDHGIQKSTDGGVSWMTTVSRVTNAPANAIAIDPRVTSTLYAGASATFDCFVAKLNSQGTALLYSTYLGGDTADVASGIAVDAFGNAYVAGATTSAGFPTRNPMQSFGGGLLDGFVAKLDTVHAELVYSTHLGGGSFDSCRGIAVNTAGNAYVTGQTSSTDFPTVVPLQGSLADAESDPFVAKLNATGSALVFSTYLGGGEGALHSSGFDFANAIAIDNAGSAYITGSTTSDNFPTTPGAFQLAKRGNSITAFVAKISDPPPFDACLQDDSNGNLLLVNTNTGDYQFINCGVLTLSGKAAISKKGCLVTLQVSGPDRRLLARIDTCRGTGTASMQVFSQGRTFTILDRNTANSACACSR